MERYGSIYVITNLVNGKLYVGQTSQNVNFRYRQHLRNKRSDCPKLNRAIIKYGQKNFSVEEFCTCFDKESLDLAETSAIAFFKSVECGYNIQHGGNSVNRGIVKSPEWIAKIVKSNRKYRGKNSSLYGKKRSEEDRQKMSANRPKRSVIGKSLSDGSLIRFESLREASRNGFYHANIIATIKGVKGSCGGYTWKYE